MKSTIFLPFILIASLYSFSQSSPAPTTTSTTAKKTVQIAGKWYIETTTTTKVLTELTTQMLTEVEEEANDVKREDDEVALKQLERQQKRAERQERNQLLKEALQKGYKPEPQTLEEQEKVRKARAKLGVRQ